ncbi:unnamed protein product [Psylliodes chrysocephalus]|uniref:Lipase domain-containing protein n=1 Tax=Psylliodes chrysocephalus TaxID=3402493 RepID=A0A9P0CQW0_9CUCU|nr:unnamed protein product [Psylliodes chrysocephala]
MCLVKILLVFTFCFAVAWFKNIDEHEKESIDTVVLYKEVVPGEWAPEFVTTRLTGYNVSETDVKIYFKTASYLFPVNLNNPEEVKSDGFSNKKDTVFIIHGLNNAYDSPVSVEISDAILKIKDANVFIVDWSNIAKQLYPFAKRAVPGIAKIVSQFIDSLEYKNGLDLDKTFIVGHSLGAHVAGLCGAYLGGRLSHIVGLDPARPLFSFEDVENRLDYSDAKFVEVIHTCSGRLGFDKAIGHVDYWPNGGSKQPGCMMGFTDFGGKNNYSVFNKIK